MGSDFVWSLWNDCVISPLVVLTYIKDQNYRLFATTLFVIIFVLLLSVLSVANNHEIVAGAAAYAADLVVFVGTTIDK